MTDKLKELIEKAIALDFIGIVRNMPTAERKHGHWIKTDWGDYKCSVCKHYEETTYAGKNKIYKDFSDFMDCNRFCRKCGAIMDGVSENENI